MTITTMYRVGIVWEGEAGAPWFSQMFFDTAGGTAVQAAAAVGTYLNSMKARQGSNITYRTNSVVETIDVATGQPVLLTTTTPSTGTGTGGTSDTVPVGVQGVAQWRTGIFTNGRELRGRTFIPGLTYTSNVNGVPDSGTISNFTTWGTSLIGSANAALCVYSRKNRLAHLVATASCSPAWGLVRSRRD